jgi:hypothetical protein
LIGGSISRWTHHSSKKNEFISLSGVAYPHYKYIERKFFDDFMRDGTIRLGKLVDFRDTENHGDVVGDNREGVRVINSFGNNVRSSVPLWLSASAVNCYVFCTSAILSHDIMINFKRDFAFSIESVDFYVEISKAILLNTAVVSTIGVVKYISDDELIHNITELYNDSSSEEEMRSRFPQIVRLKDRNFEWQNEVRAVWEPISLAAKLWPTGRKPDDYEFMRSTHGAKPWENHVNHRLPPITIKCPSARKYIKPIYL